LSRVEESIEEPFRFPEEWARASRAELGDVRVPADARSNLLAMKRHARTAAAREAGSPRAPHVLWRRW